MKKRLHLSFAVAVAVALAACANPPTGTAPASPQQQAINATYTSYIALDQGILAANKAIKTGTLKGANADKAVTAAQTAKAALDAMLAALQASAAAATPASGATK